MTQIDRVKFADFGSSKFKTNSDKRVQILTNHAGLCQL